MNKDDLLKIFNNNPFTKEYSGVFKDLYPYDEREIIKEKIIQANYEKPWSNNYIKIRKPIQVKLVMVANPACGSFISEQELKDRAVKAVREHSNGPTHANETTSKRWCIYQLINDWYIAINIEQECDGATIALVITTNSSHTTDDMGSIADDLFFCRPSVFLATSDHTIHFDGSNGA